MSPQITQLQTALQQGMASLKLQLDITQQQQLLNYLLLLEKWNRAYNLTAIHDINEMLVKHIFDSLAVLPHIKGKTMLDVGTGAGLPGVVFAIARPDWQCTLLDSNAKKIRFIQQAVLELNIHNVTLQHSRIEQFKPTVQFDTIISRAYSSLEQFFNQTMALCKPSGNIVAMKGLYPEEEMQKLVMPIETIKLTVPKLNADRHLIIMTKQ